MIRFYHATTHRFRIGDMIIPSQHQGMIFLTLAPVPHYTLVELIDNEEWRRRHQHNGKQLPRGFDRQWHVYEAASTGRVDRLSCWDEAVSLYPAEITRYIGNAAGILRNAYPHWKEKMNFRHGGYRGSAVRRSDKVR